MAGASGEPAIEQADELDELDYDNDDAEEDELEDELEDDQTDPELNDWGDDEDAKEVEPISASDKDASSNERAGKLSNRIQKINNKKRGVDLYLDNLISRATGTAGRSKEKLEEYAPKLKGGAKKLASGTKTTFGSIDKFGDKHSKKVFSRDMSEGFINFIINKPVMIIVVILLFTAGISLWGIVGLDQIPPKGELETRIQRNIRGDFEVYLPQEHETKRILDNIQKDWSTDFIIVFVETKNALPFDDPDWKADANITNLDVLREMDRFEREFNPNRGESDPDSKGDDRVEFMLSFSVIVKEINSTPIRAKHAAENEYPILEQLPDPQGAYSLPNGQDNITRIFEQMPPESRNKVILDSNGDSIYDTGIILIGITQDEQEELVENMDKFIKNEMKHSKMTLTGPIPMTQAITKRTYSEFMKTLPAAILLVAGILMLFHRTWKIVIITGVPVLCSLAITFGILGGTNVTLTPQVVLIAPILIALGVAYGLYIANRYSDEVDIEDKHERIRVAVRTTGKAIFLSALTTAIGFASLMTVSMIPLQVLGFGLSMGIMICYAVTMLVVPSLVMALNYKKKGEIKVKEKIGNVPIRHRKKILVIAIIFVLGSVALIPAMQANMDFVKMAPQDEEVIIKMREYSDKFGGGQQGIILVEGKSAPPEDTDVDGSMRDAETLEIIEEFETELNYIENTNVLSIVDFMKMIQPPGVLIDFLNVTIGSFSEPLDELFDWEKYKDYSFWDLITEDSQILDNSPPNKDKTVRLMIIDVFYNTLSNEIRAVFINSDYSKTILLVDMPTMDVVRTKEAVSQVDSIVDRYNREIDISHLTGFAAILVAVNDMLVESAIWSTVIALVLVFIVLAVIFKSFKFSGITLIPVCMVVILQPITLIGIGGIGGFINPEDPYFSGELNLFTAVIGSIIVGVGIDFGIHMTERIRERGMNVDGVKHGVATSGMAFVEATVTMIGGLCAVFLINIPAIQEFILLVMILLVYSVLGALFILPAIYTVIIRSREARGLKGEFGSRAREREERLKRLERELEELRRERYGKDQKL